MTFEEIKAAVMELNESDQRRFDRRSAPRKSGRSLVWMMFVWSRSGDWWMKQL